MINPKNELFKWGPIDGRPIYVNTFVEAFKEYPNFIDGTWPEIIGHVKNDKVIFVCDYEELRNEGINLFKKYVLNKKILKQKYSEWEKILKGIKRIERIVNERLKSMDDNQIKKRYNEWDRLYMDFWLKGFLPELSNWGGEKLLRQKLVAKHEKNFIEIFENLSAPQDLSFFQKEEIELLKIKLIKDGRKQKHAIKTHHKEYYWKENSYGFTKITDIKSFENEIKKISEAKAIKKIKKIENYPKQVLSQKNRIIRKFKIDKEIVDIANSLAYCVWWQDLRKKYIFIANHIFSKFLEEISRRKGIPFKELGYYTTPEMKELINKDRTVDTKKRFKGFLMIYQKNSGISHLEGEKAVDYIKPYLKVKIDKNLKEIKGMVVSKGAGFVNGKVKIIFSPREIHKLNDGEILVTSMTSPDFIAAMRKSSAIITDEGGMTSHAAIVSREMGKPCIVGTKIATKVLKDNDKIKVDTIKGIVRILR